MIHFLYVFHGSADTHGNIRAKNISLFPQIKKKSCSFWAILGTPLCVFHLAFHATCTSVTYPFLYKVTDVGSTLN